MKNLSIVATFVVKPEYKDVAKTEMLKLINPTRLESGCQKYELYNDIENNNTFIFEEIWQSEEHLKLHAESLHFTAFMAATKDMFEKFTVNKLTQLA